MGVQTAAPGNIEFHHFRYRSQRHAGCTLGGRSNTAIHLLICNESSTIINSSNNPEKPKDIPVQAMGEAEK
jgi:hypothetical protein